MATEIRLPELGENIESGDVLKVLVKVGDTIQAEQPVIELETDKATIEVPASVGGKVRAIHVKDGGKLKVGDLILTVEEGGGARVEAQEAAKTPAAAKPAITEEAVPAKEMAAASVAAGGGEAPASRKGAVVEFTRAARPSPGLEAPSEVAPAAPSIRRLARELGVDIDQVLGTGPGGRISEEDVRAYVRSSMAGAIAPGPSVPSTGTSLPDFTRWGEVERLPMKSVRRKTAEHMARAWAEIPSVTQYDKADVTDLEQLRKRYETRAQAAGGKLTTTAIALKVVAAALKVYPKFATSLDTGTQQLIFKKYVHIGVAVDTEHGLLVPVVRNVDKKNILELSVELTKLAEKARTRKISLEEMEGGVFTISNLGGIGGTGFSPIVNHPEVAVLGIARASLEPRYINAQWQPRLMLPLSLSYDHRVIDGAEGARFLRWVAEGFEQPFLLSLEG